MRGEKEKNVEKVKTKRRKLRRVLDIKIYRGIDVKVLDKLDETKKIVCKRKY